MKIEIESIPHAQHRYPTVGDWYEKDGVLRINVSEELPANDAILVALHELIEATLCRERGITEAQVDAFDIAYEKARLEGDNSEPGDHTSAPYYKEHFFATTVERLMAAELNVGWAAYEARLNELP